MTDHDRLAWSDSFVKHLIQETDFGGGDCAAPYSFTEGDNYVLFKFTPQQFTEIFTALLEGADFTYPNNSHQVVWNFLKSVECPMDFCQMVEDCIENNPNTQNAIKQLIENSTAPTGSVMSESAAALDYAAGLNPSCSKSVLFGQCVAIVQTINRAIEDMFEGIESSSNSGELANVIGNLPVLDELGVDAVTEFIDLMIEGIGESYASQYTLAKELDLAGKLYCLCRDDCQVTVQRVYDMYLTELRDEFDDPAAIFVNMVEVLTYMTDAEIDSSVVVVGMHFIFVAGLRLFSGLFGVGAVDRVLRIALQFASPNGGWIDAPCELPQWAYEWDLTASESYEGESHEASASASWVAGVGYYVVGSGFLYGAVSYRNARIPAGTTFNRVEFDYAKTHDGDALSPDYIYLAPDGLLTSAVVLKGTNLTMEVDGSWTMQTGGDLFPQVASNQAGASSITIRKMRIFGTGTEPALTGGTFL